MKKIKINKKVKSSNKKESKFKKLIAEKGIGGAIWSIILVGMIGVASLCLIFALYIIISAPNFDKDALYSKEASVFYYADGTEIARVGAYNHEYVNYDQLPQVFIDALLATEDSRFFRHNGLDIARFARATIGQLTGQPGAGGASTLTMQLVKNNYTNKEDEGIKGIIRKFTDIYMAVFKIENVYTKEQIIEFYVNSQWLGNDGGLNYDGLWGVETACKYYFGKSVSELTLAEASLLAGMFQNARLNDPYTYPENATARQNTVLMLMVNHGYITEEEKDAVQKIPVQSLLASRQRNMATNENQSVVDYVINEVVAKTGNDPRQVTMQVYTTIEKDIQDVVLKAENNKFYTFPEKAQEGMAITDVKNGAIVGLSGGIDYAAGGTHRALVKRQPGSTAKTFVDYAPYIELMNGSTGTYFFDEKSNTYSNGTAIGNADGQFKGMVTMELAIIESRNIPALNAFQTLTNNGYKDEVEDLIHAFGIDYGKDLYESASIGGFDGVSPVEMSGAYGVFARGGYYIEPYIYTKIIYEDGDIEEYHPKKEKIISEETAYMMTVMLKAAVDNGWSGSGYGFTDVAGKTGTTNLTDREKKLLGVPADTIPDSWSVSYSTDYIIALWYGYDIITSKTYMNVNQGWQARSALMSALAQNIYARGNKFTRPSGVISVEVEKNTIPLQLPSENTPSNMRTTALFIEGTEPTEVSNRYDTLDAPTNGSYDSSGSVVTLSWDAAKKPAATDTTYLRSYFNDNYGKFAQKYYEKRISDNEKELGNFGYNVYRQNSDGTLSSLGWTANNSFTQTNYGATTYVITASYSKSKASESKGLVITVGDDYWYDDDDDDDWWKEDYYEDEDNDVVINPGEDNSSSIYGDEDTGLN